MKIVHEGKEYSLIKIESTAFELAEQKGNPPSVPFLPVKEGWNDPDNMVIARKYKAIKIGDQYYGIDAIN